MKKSKLFAVFSVFEVEEMAALEKQIKAKISTKTEPLWVFFQLLKNEQLKNEAANVEKEAIFKRIYPKETYQDGKMRKLMHELWLEVENFILLSRYEQPFEKELGLLAFLHNHYENKVLIDVFSQLKNSIEKQAFHDIKYWKVKEQLALYQGYIWAAQYVYQADLNIPEIIYNQTIVFFVEQLKHHFFLFANKNLGKKTIVSPFFKAILHEIQTTPTWLANSLLSVYYHAVLLFWEEETSFESFSYLRPLILTDNIPLSITEKANIAFALRNYAGSQTATNFQFHHIKFELYMEHLPLGFVFSYNRISPQAFINIIELGLMLNKTQQVEMIVEQYQNYLPENIKENMLILANAYILYTQKQNDESLKLLAFLEKFEHYVFELNVRILKLKNLFELKEWEICSQQVQTFKTYLYRHEKLNEQQKEAYRNFGKYLSQLCLIYAENSVKHTRLAQEIEQEQTIKHKEWLLKLCQ